jgi:heme exporter protein D
MHYDSFVFLAPLTGFVWSACLLIYGRLLGRVVWVISGEHELAQHEARRQKKRKRLRTS